MKIINFSIIIQVSLREKEEFIKSTIKRDEKTNGYKMGKSFVFLLHFPISRAIEFPRYKDNCLTKESTNKKKKKGTNQLLARKKNLILYVKKKR